MAPATRFSSVSAPMVMVTTSPGDMEKSVGGTIPVPVIKNADKKDLFAIATEIDQLEREPVQTKSYVRFTELFRWPLALALFALTMELILAAWRGPLP